MNTTYIQHENYFLTECRNAAGRLQLAEGRTEAESRRAMQTMQRDLGNYGRPAVRKATHADLALAFN